MILCIICQHLLKFPAKENINKTTGSWWFEAISYTADTLIDPRLDSTN